MKFLYLTITAALLFGTSVTLNAAESSNIKIFPEDINYNPDIPRPAEIIGHPLGHRVARHDLLLSYMRTVADKSDRVMVETIAKTHEGRDILMLTISSPENLARIDEIKKAHVALSMPGSTQEVSDDMPVVTWLNYGVHGAEVSSTDSSMAVAYYLAAAES
ncbi:MAG: M14 family zinc carboxypeptidase, partial [Emcibacteraceae bacterium]|nr:M14 family zinc carboxypeptidase [Emcibacteraceae bacterium]